MQRLLEIYNAMQAAAPGCMEGLAFGTNMESSSGVAELEHRLETMAEHNMCAAVSLLEGR